MTTRQLEGRRGLGSWGGLGACLSLRPLWWGRGGGSGSGGILKGEQWGERWAVAPDLSEKPGRVAGQGFFLWLWLSLLDVTEIRQDWAEMWGKRTLLISLSPEDTGEAHSESAVWLLLLRCGQRSGRRQNYSSLPPPPFCSVYTLCTLQWYVERAVAGSPEPPEAGSDQAQSGGKGAPSVSEESGVLSAQLRPTYFALDSTSCSFPYYCP